MGFEVVRYLFDAQTINTDTDIPITTTGTVAGDAVVGADFVIGSIVPLVAWAFDTMCDCPQYPSTSTTTPPFPPVYPILFSSDLVYGRENFSAELKMIRGDTYGRTLIVFQDGQYFDLSECSVRMTFKWDYDDDDADAFLILTEGDGITVNDPTHGQFQFLIQPADTEGLEPRKIDLVYDAQVVDNLGNVYTVSYGKLTIIPDVTITT